MKMNRLAPLTFLTFLALASCKKEKPAQPCEQTTAGISGSYKLKSIEYKLSPTDTPVDFMAFLDACQKDDIIELKNDGTWVYNDAGIVCSPPGNDNGIWSLNGNIITSDAVINGTIQSYDCKTLICFTENVNVRGDRFTQTLTRQ